MGLLEAIRSFSIGQTSLISDSSNRLDQSDVFTLLSCITFSSRATKCLQYDENPFKHITSCETMMTEVPFLLISDEYLFLLIVHITEFCFRSSQLSDAEAKLENLTFSSSQATNYDSLTHHFFFYQHY